MPKKTTKEISFRVEAWHPTRRKWIAGFARPSLKRARIDAELTSGSFWRIKTRIIRKTVTESVVQ